MRTRFLACLIGLAALPALAGCADVKQAVQGVGDGINKGIDSVFGDQKTAEAEAKAEAPPAPPPAPTADSIYREGLQARKNGAETEAFEHFLEAAQKGHGPAAYEVGVAYKDGRGTKQDLAAGADWINKAAERGEPRAEFVLGAAYYSGTGVKKDEKLGTEYLAKAAAQGHAQAQYLLGEAFSEGRGVPKNASWAARWFGKAAAQGLGQAQFAYGVVHASGLGLPENKEAGYKWLLLAEHAGHQTAPLVRKALAKGMKEEEIKRAEARASAFRPSGGGTFADQPTVMYVQQALNGFGFDAGPVDGMMGPRTREAVSHYQEKSGLPKDGHISPQLVNRLFEAQNSGA